MVTIPDSSTISDQHMRLSSHELRDEVHAMATALLALGLRPGDRVLVLGRKSVQLAVAMLAIPRAGGIVVAPYAGLTSAQLRYIVDDASPALTIRLDSAPPATGAELGGLGEVVDAAVLRGMPVDGREPPTPAPHDPALIIYTSGSTGRPKGVVFSHENIRLGAESVAEYYGLTPQDRVLCLLPFSFDAGFNQLMSALVAGCEAHLRDFALPQHTAALCDEHRITILTGVPALWQRLAAAAWPAPARNSMRRWCNTGGHMPVDLSARLCALFPNAEPILMYGFTEAFRATYLPPALYDAKPTSVGVPIPNAAVAIVREDGALCAPTEVGELVQFGPLVTLGYWNRDDETRSKFAPIGDLARSELLDPADSRYRVPREHLERVAWSGDNVFMDGDGCIHFHSRRTELMKSQGFRVSPTEIEDACLATGLVREAVVFGIEREGDEAIAVIAKPASTTVTPNHLRGNLQASLPSYQVPGVILFRESLPVTANGKYDLQTLRREVARAWT
jgi:acyl-CoA synthetase (AMP-forming)/AMP-acid ligase II